MKLIIVLAFLTLATAQAPSAQYHLWIGSDPQTSLKYQQNIQISENDTGKLSFFQLMEIAAEKSKEYEFTYEKFDFGDGPKSQIISINGYAQNMTGNIYWMLYQLEDKPSMDNPPNCDHLTPVGVDDLIVSNGDVYLFWYRHFDWETDCSMQK